MYLPDTDIVSEFRKKLKINNGVQAFLSKSTKDNLNAYLSVITIGELRRSVELNRHCGDHMQADLLEARLGEVTTIYRNRILSLTERESQVWCCLRVPHQENSLDKKIAATALTHDLCVATRITVQLFPSSKSMRTLASLIININTTLQFSTHVKSINRHAQ